jgi:two-component system chemotaxis sensor kinase CheA
VETTVRLNVALLDSLMTLAGELVLGRNQLNEAVRLSDKQGVSAGAHRISLVTSELQAAVSLTRMQPVSGLFAKFPRLVRDLASELGKEVQLKLEGGEVELDKTIIEGLSDPLTHMVRNSVDHGIESPAVRVAAAKPAMGTVILRAKHQAGQVVIEISDDGKGLAVDKITSSALAKGMITAEQIQTMSEYDKQMLIFGAGVSTAEKLTNVSGRGVGMDVVKSNVTALRGNVEIDSQAGQGTQVRLRLPLTLAIIDGFQVGVGRSSFVIPLDLVEECVDLDAGMDKTSPVSGHITLHGSVLPLIRLREMLDITGKPGRRQSVVVVRGAGKRAGIVVDELLGELQAVIKPLSRLFRQLPGIGGSTILGTGHVALILDVPGLVERARLIHVRALDAHTPAPRCLNPLADQAS